MAMYEEMTAQGRWLFKYRSYLPLIMVGLLFWGIICRGSMHETKSFTIFWPYICLGVSYLGLFVRIVTIGHTPRGTSGRNTKNQVANELNSTGIYSVVRHPLYLGNYLVALGLFMYSTDWEVMVIYSLIYWVYYERIMFAEEEFLRGKFGPVYTEWAARTPAFIPAMHKYHPARLRFSVRNIIRREYPIAFFLPMFYALLETIRQAYSGEIWLPPQPWQWLFGVAIGCYLIIRVIDKTTRLLKVEGR